MNKTLRTTLIVSLLLIAVAAVLSVSLLAAAQLWPEASSARIQWGDHSTALVGVFDGGWFEFLVAWAAVTLAILISVVAVLVAFTVSAIALGTVALVMALPLILCGAIGWWLVRHNRLSQLPQSGAAV